MAHVTMTTTPCAKTWTNSLHKSGSKRFIRESRFKNADLLSPSIAAPENSSPNLK
jgi:hypothetical protein